MRKGSFVLDPARGAGTTVLAAVQEGYQAVGVEVTDVYYKLGTDRIRYALEEANQEREEDKDGE